MSFLEIVMQLGDSTLQTLLIFALTLLFSIPLGVLICAMRMYAWKPLQWIPRLYISVLRGTPLMLQLLVVYFGPYFLFNISLSTSYRFYAVIIAFSLNYAAYFAEIFRSGIQSIPVGQYEASRILGYGRCQMFFRIILPQTIKRILPAVTNETITLVKDTSTLMSLRKVIRLRTSGVMERYSGRTTRQSMSFFWLSAAGSEPTTSASPPDAAKGSASLDANKIFIGDTCPFSKRQRCRLPQEMPQSF